MPETQRVKRCDTRRFADKDDSALNRYDCRRRAPIALPEAHRDAGRGAEASATWPKVGPDDWCGDYEVDGDLSIENFVERLSPEELMQYLCEMRPETYTFDAMPGVTLLEGAAKHLGAAKQLLDVEAEDCQDDSARVSDVRGIQAEIAELMQRLHDLEND